MQTLNGSVITRQNELLELVGALEMSSMVGIDTEFVRERTYFPKLCLLQVASEDILACVDCIAELDLQPLFDALLERACVLHSARQDLEVIFNRVERVPSVLFDTQIAAGLIGFAPQVGLQELLHEVLAVELDKTQTRTDWSRRPLSPAALDYAFDDVRHLLPLADELSKRLRQLNRYEWLEEDCERSLSTPLIADDMTIWLRLKGIGRLKPRAQAATLALVGWREQRASTADRPRRWILSDELLMRIAASLPASVAELGAIDELPRRLVERSGREILAAVEQADAVELGERVAAALRIQAPNRSELKNLQVRARAVADALGINPEIVATKRDLTAAVCGYPPPALISGWRQRVLDLTRRS